MVTMRDVGVRAGVSTKTVSRVVNNDRYVSDDVRARVLHAIDELQFVRNPLAQTFRKGRDSAIGVAVPDLADPFFSAVVQAIVKETHQRDTAVLITQLGATADEERSAVEALLHRQVAGLIIAPTSSDHRYLTRWQQRTPIMFVDRCAHRIAADSVRHDDERGAQEATSHLLDLGHRRIAFVANSLAIDTPTRRLSGYHRALADRGVAADPALEIKDFADAGLADRILPGLFALADPPTAIFCSASQLSIRLIPWLIAHDRAQIGFVSFGDFPMAAELVPSITVIEQDPTALGESAVDRLFTRMESPTRRLKRHLVLPVNLTVRGSSRPISLVSAKAG